MARRRRAIADARLEELPTEALECRDLRHAWPRSTSSHNVLTPTRYGSGGQVMLATRSMECEGGCGTIREEDFYIDPDGRMERDGKVRYRRTRPYLIKNEPGTHHEPVDRDAVRYTLLARLYPTLKW
jgi:hypothetical protein